jgi:hypothetical protein
MVCTEYPCTPNLTYKDILPTVEEEDSLKAMQNLVISKSNLEKGLAAGFFYFSEAPSPPKFLCWDGGQQFFKN